MPKYNMISNIGVGEETTHGSDDIRKYPKKIRSWLFKKTYEIDFPLVHPQYVMRNHEYEKKITFTPLEKFFMQIEGAFLKLRYGGSGEVWQAVKRRWNRYRQFKANKK